MCKLDVGKVHLEMSIRWGGELGDAKRLEHEVRVSLVGGPEMQIDARVQGDPVREPRVLSCTCRGQVDLKQSLLDEIVLGCFSRLAEQLILQNSGQRTAQVRESVEWLLPRFFGADADLVRTALLRGRPAVSS